MKACQESFQKLIFFLPPKKKKKKQIGSARN